MSSTDSFPNPSCAPPKAGEPVWDLALMYPFQGAWSVENYLELDCGLLVEYTDGFIRVLPMPTLLHQWIVRFFFRQLDSFVASRALGEVFMAPLPVELAATKFREPDLVFLRPERIMNWMGHPVGADLVVEVVSEGEANKQRDYVEKRMEYAVAGISEYWIVDPWNKSITVLALTGNKYREHGVFGQGDLMTSSLLAEFTCDVNAVFAKCDEASE